MNLNHVFCLSGCGYLETITQREEKFIVRIRMVTHYVPRTLSRDAIWIDCAVQETCVQKLLTQLGKLVDAGQSVLITFKAGYQAFANASAGLTPEDPDHIVNLRAEFRLLEECFVDGRPIMVTRPLIWAVA